MTKDEALKLALEALGAYLCATDDDEDVKAHNLMAEAFFKLKEVLAQPPEEQRSCDKQEPYAWEFAGTIFHDRKEVFDWYERDDISDIPPLALYTAPPQEQQSCDKRTWVGLTEQEAAECWSTSTVRTWKAIEAKLKEKNT